MSTHWPKGGMILSLLCFPACLLSPSLSLDQTLSDCYLQWPFTRRIFWLLLTLLLSWHTLWEEYQPTVYLFETQINLSLSAVASLFFGFVCSVDAQLGCSEKYIIPDAVLWNEWKLWSLCFWGEKTRCSRHTFSSCCEQKYVATCHPLSVRPSVCMFSAPLSVCWRLNLFRCCLCVVTSPVVLLPSSFCFSNLQLIFHLSVRLSIHLSICLPSLLFCLRTYILKYVICQCVLCSLRVCSHLLSVTLEYLQIGLPAKSGVSGCILLVVPNVMGICLFSPRLDTYGNSVRGVEFAKVLEPHQLSLCVVFVHDMQLCH